MRRSGTSSEAIRFRTTAPTHPGGSGVIQSGAAKRYDLQVRFPGDPALARKEAKPFLTQLIEPFRATIRENRSTLLFANSRRLCERVAMLLNEDEEDLLAYSHYGSLSREVRAAVEQRLKRGELKAIVATSSLELGIDIGDLDEVLLLETPHAVSAVVQRVGRAGHHVGATSRACSIHFTDGT